MLGWLWPKINPASEVNLQLRAVRDRFLQQSLANAAALQHVRVQHRFAFTESA